MSLPQLCEIFAPADVPAPSLNVLTGRSYYQLSFIEQSTRKYWKEKLLSFSAFLIALH